MNFNIDVLFRHKHFIDDVVNAIWNEWSKDFISFTNYKTIEELKEFYDKCGDERSIPVCYILFNQTNLIGTCIIDNEDMNVKPQLKPWLTSVFILEPYRNKGYASALLQYVIPMYKILHLWTFNENLANFYKKFGFEQNEIISKHGHYENIIYMNYEKKH